MDCNGNDDKDGDKSSSEQSSGSSRLEVIKTKIVPQFRLKGIRFTQKKSQNGSSDGQDDEAVILVGNKLLPIEIFTKNLRTACHKMVITRRKARIDADKVRSLSHVITPPNSRESSPAHLPEAAGNSRDFNHQMPESPAWEAQCLKSPVSAQNEQSQPEQTNDLWDDTDEIICIDEQIRLLEAKREIQEEEINFENEKDSSSTHDESEESDGGGDSNLVLVTSKPLYDHDASPETVYNSPEILLPMISKEMAEKASEAVTCFQNDEGSISISDLISSSAAVGTAVSSTNPEVNETGNWNLSSIPISRKRHRSSGHQSFKTKESKRTKEMGESAENNVENSVSCRSKLAEETIASPCNATAQSLTPVETTENLIEQVSENVVQNTNSETPSSSSSQVVDCGPEISETVDGIEATSILNSGFTDEPSAETENGRTNENNSSAPANTGEFPEIQFYYTLPELKREIGAEHRTREREERERQIRALVRREAEMDPFLSMQFHLPEDQPADYPVLSIPEARDGDSNSPVVVNTPSAHADSGIQQDCALQSLIEVTNDSRQTTTIPVSSNSAFENNDVESIQSTINGGSSEKDSSSSNEISASLNLGAESTTCPTNNIPGDQQTSQEEEDDDESNLPIVRIRSDIFEDSESVSHTEQQLEQDSGSASHTEQQLEQDSESASHTEHQLEQDSESASHTEQQLEQDSESASHTEQQLEQNLIAPVNLETHSNGLPGPVVGPFTVLRAHPVCHQSGVMATNVQQSSILTEGLPLQRMETPSLAVPPTTRTLAVSAASSTISTCGIPEGAACESLNVSNVGLSQNSYAPLSNGGVIDSTINSTAVSTSSCNVGISNTTQNATANPSVSPNAPTTPPTSELPQDPWSLRFSQPSAENLRNWFKPIKETFDQISSTYEQTKALFEMPGQREAIVNQLDAMMQASYNMFSSTYMGKLYFTPETQDSLNNVDLRIEEMVDYFEVMFDCITFAFECTNVKMKALLTVITRRIARILKYFMCEIDESRSEQKYSNVCSFLSIRPSFQYKNIKDPHGVMMKVWDIIRATKSYNMLKASAILDHKQVGPAGFKARIAKFKECVERQRAAADATAATTLQNNQAPAAQAVSNNQQTNQQQPMVSFQAVQPAIPGHQVQSDLSSGVINQQENIAYSNQQQQSGTRFHPHAVASAHQENNLGSINPMIAQCVPQNSTHYAQQQCQLSIEPFNAPQNSCQTQNRPTTSATSQQQGCRHQLLSMPTNFQQQAQCYSQQQQQLHTPLEQQSASLQGASVDEDVVFLGYSPTQNRSNNVHRRSVSDNSQNVITISYGGRQIGETPYYGVTASASSAPNSSTVVQHAASGSGTSTATSSNNQSAHATSTSNVPTLAMLLADTGAANATATYSPRGTIPSSYGSLLGQAPSTSALGSSSVGSQYQFPRTSGGQCSQNGIRGVHVSANNIQASNATPMHGFIGNQNVNVQTGQTAPQASMTIPRNSRPTKSTRGRKPRNGRNSNQGQSQLLESAPVMGNASTYQGINYHNGPNPAVTESFTYPQWTMGSNQPSFTTFSGNSQSGTNGGQNTTTDELSVGQAHANTVYFPNSSGTNLVAAPPFPSQAMNYSRASNVDTFNQWRRQN